LNTAAANAFVVILSQEETMRTYFLLRIAFLFPAVFFILPNFYQNIARATDRPQFQYHVNGKLEELVKSEDLFRPLAAEIRKHVESIFREYKLKDPSVKRGWLSVLGILDMLEHRDDSARERLAQITALEEKPAAKAVSGLIAKAILDARREVPDTASPAYNQAVARALKHLLDELSYDLVQNELREIKTSFELLEESAVIGIIRANDAIIEKTGGLSIDAAAGLASNRLQLLEFLPVRDALTNTIGAYLSAHTGDKKDIWTDRNVALDPGKPCQAVNVAVWDTGIDPSLFKDKIAIDAGGQPAVLAYDIEFKKTSGSLYPINAEQSRKYADVKKLLKGLFDLQANSDSPEAAEMRRMYSQFRPDEVNSFVDELSFYGNYAHGSHVAGILVDGNPFARIVTGRITFDWKRIPGHCMSQELADRSAAAFGDFVEFFKANRVRVVNMSWGASVKQFEQWLEACGIGTNPAERIKTAMKWFEIERRSLEKAMLAAPDILFVAAAGNGDRNASLEGSFPSGFKMKNLLVVGAVNKAGDETSFTSYGPTVAVHANGYEVESFIPGGERMKMSGTSMASPNVVNLAAKIIAVNPKLNPAKVIELIRTTSDKTADGRRNLINPKKAIEATPAP
jgi:hypothetical protein